MVSLNGTTVWVVVLAILPAIILLHLLVAPYTKVEESFNVQAVHDILTYSIPWSNASEQFSDHYDHMTFPGAVPRTFVGALALAGLAKPLLWLNNAVDAQFLVRAVLGFFNALSLLYFARDTRKAFGNNAAVWYILLQASQFHIIYYASRPLPNMFAFGLTTMALALLLRTALPVQASLSRLRLATFILTITAIVFRSEVAILLFCNVSCIILKQIARYGHLTHGITLLRSTVFPAGIFGTLVGLAMTISTDTFFWQSPTYLWPEFSAFLSNIFPSDNSLGASAWGTQPWHWYFTDALPRTLLNPFIYVSLYLFAASNPATSEPILDLLLPNLTYMAIYSILPHKETRFIFPVIPPLTLVGALSASYIWTRRHRTWLYRIVSIGILFSTTLSALLAHAFLLPLSALSYPGAHALNLLHNYESRIHTAEMITHNINNTVSVHLDNLSTQTGITRFLQLSSPTKPGETNWIYDKSENTTNHLDPFWWTQFDYAIMESPQLAIGSWEVVLIVRGLGQICILHPHERRETEGLLTGGERLDFWEDGIDTVALQMYGFSGGQVSVAVRQILREGLGVQWLLGKEWSWTNGWWVDVGWIPKLYVLKRQESLAMEEMQEASSIHAEDD